MHLHDPTDPQSVLDLLTLRRDVMFLEYDMAVRSSMADTFLATGNIQAYKVRLHLSYNLGLSSHLLLSWLALSIDYTCILLRSYMY